MWLDGCMNPATALYVNRPSAWYVAWYEVTYSLAVIRQMSVGGSGFASQISRLFAEEVLKNDHLLACKTFVPKLCIALLAGAFAG
jgi:hypothetical protein